MSTTSAERSVERGRSARPERAWVWWVYLLPGAVLLAGVILLPLAWNVYLSFTDYRGIRPPEPVGLENWRELAGDSQFWASFRNSVAMVVAMVVVPTVVGLVLAAAMFDIVGRRFGGRLSSFLRAVFYLPQLLPVAIAGIVIGWILRPSDGALNTVLASLGLDGLAQNWLGDPATALPSIMVVLVWVQIGYPIVIFMAALQRVDPELYEAAELDGAGWWQRFRLITISMIRPEIFVVTLTCTIAALKVFGPIYVLTRGGPGDSTLVPSYYAYSEFFQSQRVGYGATVATALTAVVLVVAVVFLRAQNAAERQDRGM